MGKILEIIEELSGGKCFYSDRYTLDHYISDEYQDNEEKFNSEKVFETDNKNGQNILLNNIEKTTSIFKYFLDGSRRTYKIVDFATPDDKFLPIVAGQIGTAICLRENKTIKKLELYRKNVLTVPDRLGNEYEKIKNEILKVSKKNITIHDVLRYQYKSNPDKPFEYLAIAKIQTEMMAMEVELVSKMINSNLLNSSKMLIIDGSLQHSGIKEDNEYIFENVIGISKSFNPHLLGILKSKNKEIGHHLLNLRFGERTPVYSYDIDKSGKKTKKKIGAWYLRIRQRQYSKNPLDGVIKIEKMATTKLEKENGFESDLIDEISRAIIKERNVTCYGKDNRWANHLYPIYLTEYLLKNSFASDTYFLNIF